MQLKTLTRMLAVAGLTLPGVALATNGMNMEGYGPIASGMGGASMAYDNGTAAMMNNPATLALAPQGGRLDLAVGMLGPDVSAKMNGMPDANSGGDAYYMPALGYSKKQGALSYGVGVFAQGGMGTEYSGNSLMSAGSGLTTRSEVGVGRFLVPLSYEVSPALSIGGSIDLVWAGMDLQMAMGGAQFMDMMPRTMNPMATNAGGTVSGSMVNAFGGMMQAGQLNMANPVGWGYFNFSNDNDFTGKANATGFAGKIGMVYKVSPQLTFGATYHTKTDLGDLEASGASVAFNVNMNGGMGNQTITVPGKISVRNFQWPETYGFGLAFKANDQLMLAADYKRIGWESVMKNFSMTFTADAAQTGMAAGFANTSLDATMYQNWKDQDVFMLGAAYKATSELTLRGGVNLANNPVPDATLNALFPAIVKNHYMVGAGYVLNKAASVNFSFTYAPEVTATAGSTVVSSHSQNSWQLMYSQRF